MVGVRILLVIPITGLTKSHIEDRLRFLRSIAFEGTRIEATQVRQGPRAIESEVEAELAGPEILRLVKKAEQDGYEAVIIWCAEDPALAAARELVDVPVIGPNQSARLLASMLGKKPARIPAPLPVLELRRNLRKTIQRLKEAIEIERRKGADVFYLGCLGLWGLGRELRKEIGLPVIDPAEAALKMAETAVKLGLCHSRITYPKYRHRRAQQGRSTYCQPEGCA